MQYRQKLEKKIIDDQNCCLYMERLALGLTWLGKE